MKQIFLKLKSNKQNLAGYFFILVWIGTCLLIYSLFGNS
jgi:hypothetical protein